MSDSTETAARGEKKPSAEVKRMPLASVEPIGSAPDARTDARAEMTPAERASVFGSLITEDNDIVGLVAYSIYKQNKHDFLVAFARARGREPNEAEVAAYIVGEGTPRRLAIYRHLAQATLDGRGPDVQIAPGALASRGKGSETSSLNTKLLIAAIGLMALTLAYLVARLGMPGAA
jgi:hypothetical protein